MKQIFIESDYSSFEDFHDNQWYESLYMAVENLEIKQAFEHFSAHWWGASRAFIMPWLLVGGVYDATYGGGGTSKDKQELWNQYLKINAFKGALWKTAENAYNSTYYAYEHLIVNLINLHRDTPTRVTDNSFNALVSQSFGESLAGKVWNNSLVSVAKETRNCLVHCGGQASPKLKKMKPLPKIENHDILISANDVRKLSEGLKPMVMLLIKHYASQAENRAVCNTI